MQWNTTKINRKIGENMDISRFLSIKLCFFLFSLSFSSFSADESTSKEQWKTWRTHNNMSLHFVEDIESTFIKVKATLKVKSTLSGFLLFIQDTDNISNWLDNAEKTNVIKQIASNENIFSTYFSAVWPFEQRDIVVQTRYWQNDDLTIEISVNDASSEIMPHKGYIRMNMLYAHWKIKPLDDGNIYIEHQLLVDPKGSMPNWLANNITLRSMWKTMLNIQMLLPDSSWQRYKLNGIIENI